LHTFIKKIRNPLLILKTGLKKLSRLNKFPLSGRLIPEFPGLPFREVIISPYRFFYRVQEKTVWIAAVWHGAQLPE
jgi:toxin ParE1/3/4